jgi:hypothetical protein
MLVETCWFLQSSALAVPPAALTIAPFEPWLMILQSSVAAFYGAGCRKGMPFE